VIGLVTPEPLNECNIGASKEAVRELLLAEEATEAVGDGRKGGGRVMVVSTCMDTGPSVAFTKLDEEPLMLLTKG
jgi:hypothetical protein